MNTCLVLFTRSPSWFSRLICWATGSKWSHAAIYIPGPGGGVFDSLVGHGVREGRSLASFVEGFPDYEAWVVPMLIPSAALRFVTSQAGHPYDSRGLLWWLFPWRDWQDPSAWFCFEFVSVALVRGHTQGSLLGPTGAAGASHVSGRELYELVSRIGRLSSKGIAS